MTRRSYLERMKWDLRPGVPRSSHSLLESFLRCGELYRAYYEDEERYTNTRMLVGVTVAKVAELDSRAKIERERSFTFRQLVDEGDRVWREVSASDDEEVTDPWNLVDAHGHAIDATRAWAHGFAPQIVRPLHAEEPWPIEIPTDTGLVELSGVPDRVESAGIFDTKVGRKWTREFVDRSRQLSLYGLLHKGMLGKWPPALFVDNVYRVDRRRRYDTLRLTTARSEADYRAALEVLLGVVQDITDRRFRPAPEMAWWCSPTQCPRWSRCKYVGGDAAATD